MPTPKAKEIRLVKDLLAARRRNDLKGEIAARQKLKAYCQTAQKEMDALIVIVKDWLRQNDITAVLDGLVL
jgi:hypothetical protein